MRPGLAGAGAVAAGQGDRDGAVGRLWKEARRGAASGSGDSTPTEAGNEGVPRPPSAAANAPGSEATDPHREQEWSGRLTVAPAPPGSVAAAPQRVTHRLPGRLQRGCLPTLGNPRDTPCPRPKRSLGALGICWADFFPDCWGARRE